MELSCIFSIIMIIVMGSLTISHVIVMRKCLKRLEKLILYILPLIEIAAIVLITKFATPTSSWLCGDLLLAAYTTIYTDWLCDSSIDRVNVLSMGAKKWHPRLATYTIITLSISVCLSLFGFHFTQKWIVPVASCGIIIYIILHSLGKIVKWKYCTPYEG